ncbi:MAG: 3-deoxy-D-manno-octulosonic acid transferase [Myxococcales bacterium]|nr:3-deoxy-D-manno-octulosonic acid transferase [Myxococcales bacterium]
MILSLYAVLGIVLLPVAGLVVLVGCLLKPDWRPGVAARFGWAPRTAARPIVVWCASVGEVNTAQHLIRALLAAGAAPVTVTVFTPSGLARARELFGESATVCLAPLDIAPVVAGWLRRQQPRLVILFETEMWPWFIRSARRRDIPVAVVNGRLSDRSFKSYRLLRGLLTPSLARLNLVLAQNEEFVSRFVALGAAPERAGVSGSLKFDVETAGAPDEDVRALYRGFGAGRRLLVAGSTHAGEESRLAETLRRLRPTWPNLALIVAPRHLKRCDEAARDLEAAGCRVVRRSQARPENVAAADVLLIDVFGELSWAYGLGEAAFVGGSFAPAGGHNVLEPAALGVPVAVGPLTPNFRQEVEALRQAGVLRQVKDGAELAAVFHEWLADDSRRFARGETARLTVQKHQGATARTLAALQPFLS